MKNKLETLLSLESAEEDTEIKIPVKRNLLSQVYITKSALDKAYIYAKSVCEVFGKSMECYGYLISPKGIKDRLVRDIYLAPNQDVSSASVKVEGGDVISAGADIDKMGYRVLGWWHSHGSFGTFHSGTDDENMMKILNGIAPTNFVVVYKQMPLMSGRIKTRKRGASLELCDVNNLHKKLILNLDSEKFNAKDLGVVKSTVAYMPIRVGFAYSIVVNAEEGKPYCEIATKDFCGLCYNGEERSTRSRLRVLDQYPLEINEEKIEKDIKNKIKKPKKFVSFLFDELFSLKEKTQPGDFFANPTKDRDTDKK